MTKSKALSKEEFQSFPLAKQHRLRGTKDMALAKLQADGISLKNKKQCRIHLQENTIAPDFNLMVFETYLNGAFND